MKRPLGNENIEEIKPTTLVQDEFAYWDESPSGPKQSRNTTPTPQCESGLADLRGSLIKKLESIPVTDVIDLALKVLPKKVTVSYDVIAAQHEMAGKTDDATPGADTTQGKITRLVNKLNSEQLLQLESELQQYERSAGYFLDFHPRNL